MTKKFYIALSKRKAHYSYAVIKLTNDLTYEIANGDTVGGELSVYERITKNLVMEEDAESMVFKYQTIKIANHMGNVFNTDDFYKDIDIHSSPAVFENDKYFQNKAFQLLNSYLYKKHQLSKKSLDK